MSLNKGFCFNCGLKLLYCTTVGKTIEYRQMFSISQNNSFSSNPMENDGGGNKTFIQNKYKQGIVQGAIVHVLVFVFNLFII